jgi:hypothetical protein
MKTENIELISLKPDVYEKLISEQQLKAIITVRHNRFGDSNSYDIEIKDESELSDKIKNIFFTHNQNNTDYINSLKEDLHKRHEYLYNKERNIQSDITELAIKKQVIEANAHRLINSYINLSFFKRLFINPKKYFNDPNKRNTRKA